MSEYMIPRSAQARKSVSDICPGTDLICPQAGCGANCYFASQAARVWCPICGWALTLTAEQATEMIEALLGITDLPITPYLLILAAQATPAITLPLPTTTLSVAYQAERSAP